MFALKSCRIGVPVTKSFPCTHALIRTTVVRKLSSGNNKNILSKDEIAKQNLERIQKQLMVDPPKKLQKLLEVWEREKHIFGEMKLKSNQYLESIPNRSDQTRVDQGTLLYIRRLQVARTRNHAKKIPNNSTLNEKVENFFQNQFRFFRSCAEIESFPDETLPEIAVVGRSNVGKSSLLNSITGRKIVKASSRPGETKTVNWFKLGSKMFLVDLPGYGFALANDTLRESWQHLIHYYLVTRKSLKRVLLLVDARHGFKASDEELMSILDTASVKYQIVLTKCDLVLEAELAKIFVQTTEQLRKHKCNLEILLLSSRTGAGIDSLKKSIAGIVDLS